VRILKGSTGYESVFVGWAMKHSLVWVTVALCTFLSSQAGVGAASTSTPAAARTPDVVTPEQARSTLANYEATIAKANATLDHKLQATVEGGPALAIDGFQYALLKRAHQPFSAASELTNSLVYVPHQNAWPAHFVAFESRADLNQILLFQQTAKSAPWKVTLYADSTTNLADPDITLDPAGYAQAATAADAAVPPKRLSQATCTHYATALSGAASPTDVVSTDDAGLADLARQAALQRTTDASDGITDRYQCMAQQAPVVALRTSDGTFAVFWVEVTVNQNGSSSKPITIPPAGEGELQVLPAGQWLSTHNVSAGMFAGTVQSGSAGVSTPVDLPFGNDFLRTAATGTPLKAGHR
jgi:hypothetical protein